MLVLCIIFLLNNWVELSNLQAQVKVNTKKKCLSWLIGSEIIVLQHLMNHWNSSGGLRFKSSLGHSAQGKRSMFLSALNLCDDPIS